MLSRRNRNSRSASMVERVSRTNIAIVRSLITNETLFYKSLKRPLSNIQRQQNQDVVNGLRAYNKFSRNAFMESSLNIRERQACCNMSMAVKPAAETSVRIEETSRVIIPPIMTLTKDISETKPAAEAVKKNPPLPPCRVQRSYKCEKCDFSTQNPREYLLHLNQQHQQRISINGCTHCTYASRYYQKLKRHIHMVHGITLPDGRLGAKQIKLTDENYNLSEDLLTDSQNSNFYATPNNANKPKLERMTSIRDPETFFSTAYKQQLTARNLNKINQAKRSINTVNIIQHSNTSKAQFPKLSPAASVGSKTKISLAFHCKACPFFSTSIEAVREHKKCPVFVCQSCMYQTHEEALFMRHRNYHSTSIIKCNICDFRTNYKWNLARHMRNHRSSGLYKCEMCSFTAHTKQSLTTHKNNHHDVRNIRNFPKNRKHKSLTPVETITENVLNYADWKKLNCSTAAIIPNNDFILKDKAGYRDPSTKDYKNSNTKGRHVAGYEKHAEKTSNNGLLKEFRDVDCGVTLGSHSKSNVDLLGGLSPAEETRGDAPQQQEEGRVAKLCNIEQQKCAEQAKFNQQFLDKFLDPSDQWNKFLMSIKSNDDNTILSLESHENSKSPLESQYGRTAKDSETDSETECKKLHYENKSISCKSNVLNKGESNDNHISNKNQTEQTVMPDIFTDYSYKWSPVADAIDFPTRVKAFKAIIRHEEAEYNKKQKSEDTQSKANGVKTFSSNANKIYTSTPLSPVKMLPRKPVSSGKIGPLTNPLYPQNQHNDTESDTESSHSPSPVIRSEDNENPPVAIPLKSIKRKLDFEDDFPSKQKCLESEVISNTEDESSEASSDEVTDDEESMLNVPHVCGDDEEEQEDENDHQHDTEQEDETDYAEAKDLSKGGAVFV